MNKYKGAPVIVERVGNGYQVRPMIGHEQMICMADVMVFQDKGFVVPRIKSQPIETTLLGWLEMHFTEEERSDNDEQR